MSPMGISYIGASKEKLGQAACCAVKRIHLDARIAKRAAATGADLKENFEVGVGVCSYLVCNRHVRCISGVLCRRRVAQSEDSVSFLGP